MKNFSVALCDVWFNRYSDAIRSRLPPGIELETVTAVSQIRRKESVRALISYVYDAECLSLPGLRLLQIPGRGADGVDYKLLPDSVRVCNTEGHENAMFQYTLMMILAWLHNFREVTSLLSTGSWSLGTIRNFKLFQELSSQHIGVVGLGNLGRHLCGSFQKLGAHIYGISNQSMGTSHPFPVVPYNRIDSVLPELDFVVLCCRPTESSRNIINQGSLRMMKKTSVVINVARQDCVSEGALYYALKDGRIGGAVLDVWGNYPTAQGETAPFANYPFHALDNVIATPHCSALSEQAVVKRCTSIADNIGRLYEGRPLLNCL